jgi:hypothetical protein
VKPERLAKPIHREVSTLPPSRDHLQKLKKLKKTKPVKPDTAAKNHGQGQGTGKPETPKDKGKPPVATAPTPPVVHGKSGK